MNINWREVVARRDAADQYLTRSLILGSLASHFADIRRLALVDDGQAEQSAGYFTDDFLIYAHLFQKRKRITGPFSDLELLLVESVDSDSPVAVRSAVAQHVVKWALSADPEWPEHPSTMS